MKTSRFPRSARVRARSDFDRIFKQGRRVALPLMALHVNPLTDTASAQAGPRLGLAVSRKVDPRAVGRNRIKRVLRDAFRHWRDALPAADYVLVARPGASRCTAVELREAFAALLRRALPSPAPALPVSPPAATMRPLPSHDGPAAPDSPRGPSTPASDHPIE